MSRQKYSYSFMLETLGAWLDDTSPKRFTLLEVVDGFSVILTPNAPGRPDLTEITFDRDTLLRPKRRSVLTGFSTSGPPRRWSLSISGREEFLTALGYELDVYGAHAVMLDELDNQLLLTYSYMDATQGFFWHKHIVYLGPREISVIVEVAEKRKREQKKADRIFKW